MTRTERNALSSPDRGFPYGRALAFVLVLALGLRLVYSLAVFSPLLRRKGEELGWVVNGRLAVDPYDRIARNLVDGRGYVDDTGRTNLERLPLYPYLLAAVYKLWGTELWKVQVVQAFLDTLSCLLVYLLAARVFASRSAALLAAVLYAAYFKMIVFASRPETETLYVLLLLGFLSAFTASLRRPSWALPAGVGLGLLTLVKPATLLFPAAALVVYWAGRKPLWLKKTVLFLAGFSVCLAPLFVVNYLREGRVFLATGGGKMLYMGAVIDYRREFRTEEQRLIKEINERYAFPYRLEDDARLRRLALARIAHDPLAYAGRILRRLYLFWTYPDYSTPLMALKTVLVLVFNLLALGLALTGFLFARRDGRLVSPFLAVFLYIYAAYALIYAYSRYSVPLFPLIFMFASYALVRLWNGRRKRRPGPRARGPQEDGDSRTRKMPAISRSMTPGGPGLNPSPRILRISTARE